jgi:hypothetical protein
VNRLPVRVQTLIALVVTGGMACLLARLPDLAQWEGTDLAAFCLLTAGIVLTEQFQIPLRFGTETLNVSLTEALWVGALVLARPSVLTCAVTAGVLIGQTIRRRAPYKVAYNAGQFVIALTAAQLVVAAVRGPTVLQPMTFLAVGLGMTAYAALNAGLVALVIARATESSFPSVLLPPLMENAVHFAANTALGLAAAVLWQSAPSAVPVLIFPLAMSFIAYRTLLQSVRASLPLQELIP